MRHADSTVEVFETTIADAELLVKFVEGFTNQRKYRMRKELRDRIGDALNVKVRDRDHLDCIESDDVFMVLKPGGRLARSDFADARPLLRQALVSACAAFETYLADKAMTRIGPLMRRRDLPRRLEELPMTLADWRRIAGYQRKGRGVREWVIEPAVRERSSTAPSRIGELLAMVGISRWNQQVDGHRRVRRGQTERELAAITERRNRIVHEADRRGRGRAPLTVREVRHDIEVLRSVVRALEAVFTDAARTARSPAGTAGKAVLRPGGSPPPVP